MSRIFITGWGAVSPAGWTANALQNALDENTPLPVQPLERPGWERPLRSRMVPAIAPRPAFLAHPRLRRASPITHYAAAAALEALLPLSKEADGTRRLGIIVCLQSGCVQYTYRFFKEALEDQTTASPLLFPETVFAAPASHIAVLMDNVQMVYTLIGDPAAFAQGLAMAAHWLLDNQVDACLVVGSEEMNWLRADALWHLEHPAIISSGAGALCLCRQPIGNNPVELAGITRLHAYTKRQSRAQAALAMRSEMGTENPLTLLCDGLSGSRRSDSPEQTAWSDWNGARLSPKKILGEGLMAASAWQCVAACNEVALKSYHSACISLVGCNQHAVGIRIKQMSS